MIKNNSIKLKATFLFIVFAMNTVVGFACAIGVDMGFNSNHHHDDEAINPAVHVHSNGKKHIHHEASDKQRHDKSHHHEAAVNKSHAEDGKQDCCNDKVIKFEQADKSIAQTFTYISPVFFSAFLSAYYYKDVLYAFRGSASIKHFVRSYHPPIPDIVIAFQSFRI